MKIDNYITHLQLKQKGLKKKLSKLLKISDKAALEGKKDPNFDETNRIRKEIADANNKLIFLSNLRKEMIKIENNRVQKNVKK